MKKAVKRSGQIYLIGGAEDRKGDQEVLKYLVSEMRPQQMVLIPTASAYPQEVDRCYTGTFLGLGINGVQCLDIRYRDEADRGENLAAIDRADLVYFGGGDQAKLVATLKHTRLFDRIKARFEARLLNIAGTSAGASAIGNPLFYDGDRKGFLKGSIKSSEGFGLIGDVAVDTHFSARNRLARLCQFLLSGHCTKGIGLDEDTAIMVYPDLHFRVIGSGMVAVVDSSEVTGSNYNDIEAGQKIRFNRMRVGYLPPGSRFSIKKWSILDRVSSQEKIDTPALRAAGR